MQLNLSIEAPDRPPHACLVLGVFSNEKPPRGPCGLIDWRLNGMISREIKKGRILGRFQEQVIIPGPGRIGSQLLFLFGMGDAAQADYDRIYTTAYDIAAAVDKMRMKDFSMDLPGAGRCDLSTSGIVEAVVSGWFDYFSTDVHKLAAAKICMIAEKSFSKDIAQGLERFEKNVRHLGSVDLSAVWELLHQGKAV